MIESHPYLELDILIRTQKMTELQKDRFIERFKALVEAFGWEYSGSFTPLKEEDLCP